MKRYLFIDQLRALAIYLIVFGHNDYSSYLGEFLSSFRLPLFFIISGLVGREKDNLSRNDFLIKYSQRLLVPYFIISSLLYVFWFFIGRHYGESNQMMYDPLRNLIGIFYAQGGPEYMNWGIPMWFLPALFIVSSIDFLACKLELKYQYILALVIPVAGYYLYKLLGFHLPWSIDVAMAVYGFYFFGKILKSINFIDKLHNIRLSALIIAVAITVHVIGVQFNGRVLYYYGEYGNLLVMYINGIAGFVWVFTLFSFLPSLPALAWIGRNTLPILAFHLLAMTFIKGFALYVLGVEVTLGLWQSLIYSVLQISILVPAILFLNRYLPFMVGIETRKHS